MEDSSGASGAENKPVGMRITSDPDRTEIEQPETFEARESTALPFRMLLVSDLTPQSSRDWAAGEHLRRVDKNSFADLMATWAPQLSLDVPNAVSETPKTLDVSLQFAALEAFRPEGIAQQIPALKQLTDIQALVQAVNEGDLSLDEFQTELEAIGVDLEGADELYQLLADEPEPPESGASSTASAAERDDSLDRLLGMVETGEDDQDDTDDPAPPSAPDELAASNGDVGASSFVGALMGAVSGEAAGQRVAPDAAQALLQRLSETLSEQVGAILAHPDFRRLEAAWRGLKFLVDRTDFRENIELMVLPAARDDLHEALHYQVLLPEHSDDHDTPPYSMLVVDMDFGREHLDIEQLQDLAGTGESLQTPVVTGASPAFFGIEKMSGLTKLPALRPHLQGDAYVEWKALREEDAAQFLGLALPAFLLRYPYGADRPVEGFSLREDSGLWGSGALIAAVAAAQSFADTGWPSHLTEYPIENLPVQPTRGGQSPLAALLPGRTQSELARAGFIVLNGTPNHDAVRVRHAATVRRPDTYDDPAATTEARRHATLACQLFVARAAHHLLALQDGVPAGASVEAVQQEVTAAMASFLGVPMPDAEANAEAGTEAESEAPITVDHVTNVDLPEHELLAVRMRPPASALKKPVQLVMGLQIANKSA